jgi:hypothetical protein
MRRYKRTIDRITLVTNSQDAGFAVAEEQNQEGKEKKKVYDDVDNVNIIG